MLLLNVPVFYKQRIPKGILKLLYDYYFSLASSNHPREDLRAGFNLFGNHLTFN